MKMTRNAVAVIRQNWRAYVTINLIYYGVVAAGMIFVAFCPEIQKTLLERVHKGLHSTLLAPVASAYQSGNVWKAIVLTFFVNLLGGSLISITVPSMIVPFSGLVLGMSLRNSLGTFPIACRPDIARRNDPSFAHAGPRRTRIHTDDVCGVCVRQSIYLAEVGGEETPGGGYLLGLRQTAFLYVLVTLFLAVVAVYEALEVIYLVLLFK